MSLLPVRTKPAEGMMMSSAATTKSCSKLLARLIGLAAGLLASPGVAPATPILFTVGNPDIAGNANVTSPYADLSVTGDASTGALTFNLTLAPANAGKASFGEFGFNLAPGVSANDFSVKVTGTAFDGQSDASAWTNKGSGQLDGFGQFDVVVGPSSASNRLTSVSIELDFAAGKFAEATPASVERLNSGAGNLPGQFYFAAHLFPNSGNTGYIGADALAPAPEPSSIAILASECAVGLGGLGLFFFLRRNMALVATL